MEIAPGMVKTEPPEDAVPSKVPEIELGEVKLENNGTSIDKDPLECSCFPDEVKEELILTVDHGMLLPMDMAKPIPPPGKMDERYELHHEEERIREVLQQLEQESDDLGPIESSDESIQDELIEDSTVVFDVVDEVELEADPDYEPQTSSDEEEMEVEEFDVEAVEEAIDNAIANSEENENIVCNSGLPGASKKRNHGNMKGEKRKRKDNAKENDNNFLVSTDGDLAQGREDKDGNAFIWKTKPLHSESDKTPRRNFVHATPGPVGSAREALEPIDCFSLFVTYEMLDLIMTHTNEEIKRNQNSNKDKTFAEIRSVEELKALLGLFIYGAIKKDDHLPTTILFNSSHCGDWYRSSMSVKRFEFLVRCLRFDDKTSRDANNKFAPISDVWNIFTSNCKKNYEPGSYTTIDEQLIGFRGKCPFRMYLPNKPAKYGIKNIVLCDSSTQYMIDGIVYTGSGLTTTQGPVASYFVNELVQSIENSNRNVTFGSWFTSIPLVSELLNKGLTVIGTVRKNKKQLPSIFTNLKYKNRKVGSSLYLYHEDMLAVSYKAKANKMVTLLSSMHDSPEIHPYSKKPYVIHAYNATKGGVDTLDQLCSSVSCNRRTKRWPLCFFYNILNIACVNSYIIYKHNFYRIQRKKKAQGGSTAKVPEQKTLRNKNEKSKKEKGTQKSKVTRRKNLCDKPLTRLEFMLRLNEHLSYRWKEMRLANLSGMSKELVSTIQESLRSSPPPPLVLELPGDNLEDPVPSTSSASVSEFRTQPVPSPTQEVLDGNPEAIEASLETPTSPIAVEEPLQLRETSKEKAAKRKYCDFCATCLKRKTSTQCSTCNRLICGSHTAKKLCRDC